MVLGIWNEKSKRKLINCHPSVKAFLSFMDGNTLHMPSFPKVIINCVMLSGAVVPDANGMGAPSIAAGKFGS